MIEIRNNSKKVVIKQKKFNNKINTIEPDFSSIRKMAGNKVVFEMLFQKLKTENRQING